MQLVIEDGKAWSPSPFLDGTYMTEGLSMKRPSTTYEESLIF